ncbi:MAG: tyrosine-type recombinase/integrase, partial [Actinomycetes bacterium]
WPRWGTDCAQAAHWRWLHDARAYVCGAAHDLRHSYATWLVSDRVPINDIVAVMGHENASTTLNLYTHRPDDRDQLIRDVFDDFSLSSDPVAPGGKAEEPSEQGS